jgi:hypothetical protein
MRRYENRANWGGFPSGYYTQIPNRLTAPEIFFGGVSFFEKRPLRRKRKVGRFQNISVEGVFAIEVCSVTVRN